MVERKTTPRGATDKLVELRSPVPGNETGEGDRPTAQAEVGLRLTRLGRLVNAHPDALWLVDEDGVILEVNRSAAALMDLDEEAMVGARFVDLIPSDLARTYRRRVEDVFQTGLPVFYVHTREDRDIEFHLYPAPSTGGRVANVVIIGRDVTGRRSEESGPVPEESLRQLTLNLREAYVLLQVEPPGVVLVSPAFEEVFQLSIDELMANPWALMELIHPDDLGLLRNLCMRWRAEPQSFEFEYRIVPPDGRVRWIVSRGFPITDQTGRPNRLATVSEDITDRKQAEAARRESDRRYRSLVEGSRDGVMSVDLEGRILVANPAAARILGYDDPRELVGLLAESIHQEPARRGPMISRLRERGFLDEVDLTFKRPDGGVVEVMGSATVDFDAAGRPVGHSFIFSDVTRRKMAEEALLANQRQLSALTAELAMIEERERRRIAASLHDRVGTNLFSAKIKIKAVEAVLEEGYASRELAGVSVLIDRIIQDARSLTCELALPVLYELGLEAAVEWLAEKVQTEHGLAVRVVDDGRRLPQSDEMRALLFRSVSELVHNAVKHAQASSVEIRLDKSPDEIRIRVVDDGVGFEAEGLSSGRKLSDGWGLFSIRERLTYVGGRLEIKSRPGQGTEAYIRVPLTGAGDTD